MIIRHYLALNGIASKGYKSVDKTSGDLRGRGHIVYDVPIQVRRAREAFWHDAEEDADIIVQLEDFRPGSIAYGHSFGAARVTKTAEREYVCAMVLINAAMPRDYDFSNVVQQDGFEPTAIYAIHAPKDYVIMSGWAYRIVANSVASVLGRDVDHAFGLAGAFGFEDPRVTNISITGWGHNSAFEENREATRDLLIAVGEKHWQGLVAA